MENTVSDWKDIVLLREMETSYRWQTKVSIATEGEKQDKIKCCIMIKQNVGKALGNSKKQQ